MGTSVKPGLFRDSFARALRGHHKLPLRSEAQHHYHDLFVDVNQLEALETPDWQVLFGRRGTGKTFLLKLLQERCTDTIARDRVLSVYISAQDTKVSPVGREVSDRVRAVGFFQTFVELLVSRLTDSVQELLGRKTFLDAMGGSARKRTEEQVEDVLLELLNLVEVGSPVAAFDDVEMSASVSDARTERKGGGLDFRAGVRASGVTGAGGVRVASDKESEKTAERRTQRAGPSVPRYAKIRGKLLELLDLLNIRQLIVLIDEWSVLDPSATTAIQPEFAELLKRTLAGTPQVSVKIATNRYQTRFSNRGAGPSYRGLELGADLFEATNLDRALLGDDELARFYEQLLFKRLAHLEDELLKFDPDGRGCPDEQFVLSIFRTRDAFLELVKGAEGIPRDFLIVFNTLAQENGHEVDERWRPSQVRRVLLEKGVSGQREIEYQSEASQLLSPCIKDAVIAASSRLFVMKRDDAGEVSSALDELLEKRLIHEYPSREIPMELRDGYRAYLLDYGLWLDWERALQHGGVSADELVPRLDLETISDSIVDIGKIARDNLVTCGQCRAVFPTHCRPYKMRRLCPECYGAADEEALTTAPALSNEPIGASPVSLRSATD